MMIRFDRFSVVRENALFWIILLLTCKVLAQDLVVEASPATVQLAGTDVDSPEFEKAVAVFRGYREVHSAAPSLDVYYEEIEKHALSNAEQSILYAEVVKQQRPPISLSDLIAVLQSKIDSIKSFRCSYTTTKRSGMTCEYAFDGVKFLMHDGTPDEQKSYDGELIRDVESSKEASIYNGDSISRFHRPDMPLCRAMLFRPQLLDMKDVTVNIVDFLNLNYFTVVEATSTIDDSRCLRVGCLAYEMFLDLDRNFAIKRLDSYTHKTTDAGDGLPVIVGHSIKGSIAHSGFTDYGNGIWLPSKIEVSHSDGSSTVVEAKEIQINPQIPHADFVDIIPDGVLVKDGVKELVYVWGQRSSIDQVLQETTPVKSRWVLVWVNLCVLAVAFSFYAWRKLRLSRGSSGDQR